MQLYASGGYFVNMATILNDVTNTEAPAPSDVAGDRVRQLRKRQGMTVEQVAERCVAVGAPELTANAIYLIEGGRKKDGRRTRKVTIDEAIALACALGVSPLALVLPDQPGEYAVTSGLTVDVLRFYDWLVGHAAFPFGDQDAAPREQIPSGIPDWLATLERASIAEYNHELKVLADTPAFQKRWEEMQKSVTESVLRQLREERGESE